MENNFILPIIIFLTMFIILIAVLVIIANKKKKKFKKTIEDLDYEKNKLIGVPILSELSKVRELVKTENLKQKLSDWDEQFKDLKENKIDALTDLITDADFLIEKKDYKNALRKIAYIEISLETLKKKTDNLLEEVKVITKSEERNRSIVTKLKVIYRELESKYERTEKDYGPLCDSIKEEFSKIDQKFKIFESYMEENDYVGVEKIVVDLEENINNLKSFLEITPSLILIGTIMIPNKIEETKTQYFRMQRDGYPLDYLNIEYNIKEIEKNVSNIIENLKTFKVGNSEIELKTMLDYFNTIFASFDKEKESKDIFRENIKKL